MAAAGYSNTPLPKKLGVGQGHRVALLYAPPDFADLLQPLPEGCAVLRSPRARCDVIIVFCHSARQLSKRLPRARKLMHAHSGVWLAWPKKSAGVPTDLSFDKVQSAGLAAGLVDNKIAALSDVWSGLRIVVRKSDRAQWPQSD